MITCSCCASQHESAETLQLQSLAAPGVTCLPVADLASPMYTVVLSNQGNSCSSAAQ